MDENRPQLEKERELLDLFEWAVRHRRDNYDEMAVKHRKQYLAHIETQQKGNIIQPDGTQTRSRLFIPRTYEQLDAWRARLVKSFFSSRPYVDFIPMPRNELNFAMNDENELKAKIASCEIDMQLEKNKIIKKYYDFITSIGIYPAGIMGVGWRYEEKNIVKRLPSEEWGDLVGSFFGKKPPLISQEVKEVVWDDNEITNVNYFDFWPDPRGRNSDTDTWRFCFQQEMATVDRFNKHLNWLKSLELGEIYDFKLDELISESKSNGAVWTEQTEMVSESFDGTNNPTGDSILHLLHYYNGEEYGLIVNKLHLIYYGKTPYQRHKKIPFIVQSFEPLPNEVYGRSFCYWLGNLQDELNTTRNQRIDNVSLILNPVLITRGEDKDDELISYPGAIWHEDFEGQHRWMTVPDTTGAAVREEQIIKGDMENTVGTPAIARGVTSGGQTATEVVTQNSNASIRFDIKIQLYEEEVKKLFALMDMNNQQFITTERAVYFYGEDAENAWRVASPYDFQGEWDYRPTGSNIDPAANKEVRRQQFMQLIEMGKKLGLNYNYRKMERDLLACFDFRNPYAYLPTPDEVEQQQAAQMEQQLQMAQMGHQQELEKIQAQNEGKQQQEIIKGLSGMFKESMKGGDSGGSNRSPTKSTN